MVAAMLPVLGVDGIQGVGGSLIVRPDDFDSISHTHLLLASPRKSLLEVIRPKSGSTDPEVWSPMMSLPIRHSIGTSRRR